MCSVPLWVPVAGAFATCGVFAVVVAVAATVAAAGQSGEARASGDARNERTRQRTRLQELHAEARALLEQAGASGASSAEVRTRLADVFESLAREALARAPPALVPSDLRDELQRAAADLRQGAETDGRAEPGTEPFVQLLDRLAARLKGGVLGLDFQGSYSQTKVAEPVYGGHASAMGPPPAPPPADLGAAGPVAVQFEEAATLPVKTYCGGPTKEHILESGGSGVGLLDYDGDGRLDVYLVNSYELTADRKPIPHRNALFRNLGGWRFEDVSAQAGVDAAAWGNGVCAADYDGDGDLDMYVTNFGPDFLFRNEGDGAFTEVAREAGIRADGWSTGCSFFDPDGDGDLDLYVAGYVATHLDELARAQRTLTWRGGPKVMVGPVGLPGQADLFFENRGDGTFSEATEARGLGDPARAYGFGVVATDYDDDGWPDLFVANDTNPNFLYRNRSRGSFESMGLIAGVALNAEGRAQAGMGVDSGDYDGDGRLDLVVTNFAQDTNTLYRNVDGTQFEDVTAEAGLAAATFERMGWGVAFLDADLDGDLDLFFANGHIYADVDRFPALQESFAQTNQVFVNDAGRFTDVSDRAGGGLQVQKVSRGLAAGDLDGDGDLDLVVSNIGDAPSVLENRQASSHHWIAFKLDMSGPNRWAIGARVTVETAGRRQVREVRSGGSYLSQNDLRAHFGLGSHAGTVDVEVRLGTRSWRFPTLPVDRTHDLKLDADAGR